MSNQSVSILIVAILFYGALSHLNAQSAGLYFSLAFPSGEFKENVKQTGVGLNGEFLFLTPQKDIPVGLGVNLGFYIYGSETRSEPWSPSIPDVRVNVERTNNLANFHLLLLIAPQYGRLRPYAEGLIGGSYFFTKSSVRSRYNEEAIAEDVNFDDWAWSYGAGAGIAYLVSGDPKVNNNALFIDLKVRYLLGTEAEYLKKGSIYIEDGNLYYDVNKSKTNLISAHLGVRYYFSWKSEE